MATKWNDGEVKPTESGWYWRNTGRWGEHYEPATRYYYSTRHKAWFADDTLKSISSWQGLQWRKGKPNE